MKSFLKEIIGDAKTVLLAGIGGGFDIYAGLPLLYELKKMGVNVVLANYSFTELSKSTSAKPFDFTRLIKSTDEEHSGMLYFPEKHLKTFLEKEGFNIPLYAFERTGIRPLQQVYDYVINLHHIDHLMLVDGGTDSLMRGDEVGLGTPIEDVTSMVAARLSSCSSASLFSIGYGVDRFHGVSDYLFLENVAELTKSGSFIGSFHAMNIPNGLAFYKRAVDYSNTCMPYRQSIVNNSIVSSAEGAFGDVHKTQRTKGSELWINPLMSIYWIFDLKGVTDRLLYFDDLKDTQTSFDVNQVIYKFRLDMQKRLAKQIPG